MRVRIGMRPIPSHATVSCQGVNTFLSRFDAMADKAAAQVIAPVSYTHLTLPTKRIV